MSGRPTGLSRAATRNDHGSELGHCTAQGAERNSVAAGRRRQEHPFRVASGIRDDVLACRPTGPTVDHGDGPLSPRPEAHLTRTVGPVGWRNRAGHCETAAGWAVGGHDNKSNDRRPPSRRRVHSGPTAAGRRPALGTHRRRRSSTDSDAARASRQSPPDVLARCRRVALSSRAAAPTRRLSRAQATEDRQDL